MSLDAGDLKAIEQLNLHFALSRRKVYSRAGMIRRAIRGLYFEQIPPDQLHNYWRSRKTKNA